MFTKKYPIEPSLFTVRVDLQSVVEVLSNDKNRNRVYTADELKWIEDYLAERVKHVRHLRKQASK